MSTKAKADHEVLLTWRKDTGVLLHSPKNMKLGQTVHYHSKRGKVEIYFHNGSPFLNRNGSKKKEVDGNDPPLELKVIGKFKAQCFIRTPKGVVHGYEKTPKGTPLGGGDVIVKGAGTVPQG
jgi:hypothetical protein